MRILHLPTSVGGNSWGLAQGEKALGLDSKVLVDSNNWLKYKSDICLGLENKNKVFQVLKKIETFFKVRNKYDVYHFNFGSSLVDYINYGVQLWDLPFYKGKKFMTYNGSDARQNLNALKDYNVGEIYDLYPYNDCRRNDIIKKRIEKVCKNVDHIFSLNPDLMYFLPADKTSFLPYTIAGWDEIEKCEYRINDKIKIVHSPTNRLLKGSDYILKALDKLSKKYKNIEIDIIEKVPHEVALQKYKEAHIVIDQVLAGWYGAFGAEAMKMGKPLAVFIREEDLHFIPEDMARDLKGAVININKDNIYEKLEECIASQNILYEKSSLGYEYVMKWHNPLHVANVVKKHYEENLNR